MPASAFDRTNEVFKVFQFPADKIPRIDGDTNDWSCVPENYVITTGEFVEDFGKHQVTDASTPKIRLRCGWVKGLNRLYFLYEADDDYWDFSQPDLHNDTFELIVNGGLSTGPFIERFLSEREKLGQWETYFLAMAKVPPGKIPFTPTKIPTITSWCWTSPVPPEIPPFQGLGRGG